MNETNELNLQPTEAKKKFSLSKVWPKGLTCLIILGIIFGYLGYEMGAANMLNTIMHTAHDLLLNTVFFLLSVLVITGALGSIMTEFGVVNLIEKLLRPLMKPLFNLPGVASLGATMTFLSDNPAVITLARDKQFASYFRKYQIISLTNFGTAFGMGILVIVFMAGMGFFKDAMIGLFGAFCGAIVSTRLMQRFILKSYPHYKDELAAEAVEIQEEEKGHKNESMTIRILNCLLDGGKGGVEVGMTIIPGVLIISTFVMMLTFGAPEGGYTGAAYEGVQLLPWIGEKLQFLFKYLFGFNDPHLIAFPITALGAVGAALSIVPTFLSSGWIDGNAIAVFTAIGMCWSGYLSTHTAMLDSLGYRELTGKAILAHTVGGLCAAIIAHLTFLLFSLF